jgi:hypothetical protein
MSLRARLLTMPCLLLAAAALPAQTLVAAGDATLSLAHLLRGHPEGMLLCLPSSSGQSLAQALDAALDQEPALDLQLSSQELSLELRAGRELARLKGWSAEQPHWALVAPGGRLLSEGTAAPSAAALLDAYRASGLSTRADLLRAFLRTHPDHADALARLILELRGPAERRTQLLAPASEDPSKPPVQLKDEDDARIWDEYAGLYERLLGEGHWLEAGGETGPLPVAMPLSAEALHSPRLRSLAERMLPGVERDLRRRPGDERRWKVWLSLRAASGKGRPHDLLAGLTPPPGSGRWPPPAAVDAFVEDARQTGDWRSAEPLLEAAYEDTQAFLRDMAEAAREDAARTALGAPPKVELGAAFGFGGWTGELALLVEAKLRLGRFDEADRIFMAAYGRVPRSKLAEQAAALARECGAEALAAKWAALVR